MAKLGPFIWLELHSPQAFEVALVLCCAELGRPEIAASQVLSAARDAGLAAAEAVQKRPESLSCQRARQGRL